MTAINQPKIPITSTKHGVLIYICPHCNIENRCSDVFGTRYVGEVIPCPACGGEIEIQRVEFRMMREGD